MKNVYRFIFYSAAVFAMALSGCASKPAAVQEIILSSDTMAVTLYGYDIGGGYKSPSSYTAFINVKDFDESSLETIGASDDFAARLKETSDQYQSIWNSFGDELVQYLKTSDFKETAQVPSNDDLAFMVETPDAGNVYFYRYDLVKFVGDQTVCYSVSDMKDLLDTLAGAAQANDALFSSLTSQ